MGNFFNRAQQGWDMQINFEPWVATRQHSTVCVLRWTFEPQQVPWILGRAAQRHGIVSICAIAMIAAILCAVHSNDSLLTPRTKDAKLHSTQFVKYSCKKGLIMGYGCYQAWPQTHCLFWTIDTWHLWTECETQNQNGTTYLHTHTHAHSLCCQWSGMCFFVSGTECWLIWSMFVE